MSFYFKGDFSLDNTHAVYGGKIKNISIKGLSVYADNFSEEALLKFSKNDTAICMEFKIPGNDKLIKATGEALHLFKEPGFAASFGIIFTEISEEDRGIILNYILRQLRKK